MRLPHEHTVKLSGKLPSGHFNYGFKSPTFLPFSRLTLMCVVPIIISTHTNALPTGMLSVTYFVKIFRQTELKDDKENSLTCRKGGIEFSVTNPSETHLFETYLAVNLSTI